MFTKNLGELSQQFENKLSVLMKSCKQFSYLSTFSDPNSFMTVHGPQLYNGWYSIRG